MATDFQYLGFVEALKRRFTTKSTKSTKLATTEAWAGLMERSWMCLGRGLGLGRFHHEWFEERFIKVRIV